ncbi:hypothetical protein JRQ81_019584 [Phrynocephalus forsythii]|uniref:CEP63/Deup1 CEP152 binding coiled coil domain-containing protein n=1 Tax=Phrynocephalus forsythii TaxID=171643 RepID=A0A9Q0XN89_9SAUR|nr:hypothetical protein JRQ81_019584 [Phrynocephalus forsythii]
MLEKQKMTDVSKTELKTYLDSTNLPAHENEWLHSEHVKLPKDTNIPLLVKPITCFGTNHVNQTAAKIHEKLLENESEQALQSVAYENFGCYRRKTPTWHGQGDIENSCPLAPQRPSRDREPVADGRSPSPPEAHSVHNSTCSPEKTMSDMLLNYIYVMEENQVSSPEALGPPTATEKFLQEEENRARDFELVLNSHIDELQRQTEHTLKKYSSLNKHSRHR